MAPKHALPAAPKPPKRRRRQASVRSFFAPKPQPAPPSPPSPPCVSSSPSPPASQPPATHRPHSPPPTPPPPPSPPSLACVSLPSAVDVQPAHVAVADTLSLCVAAAAVVDVPPVTSPVRARVATRSSMRLRSVSHQREQQPVLTDSDCETKPLLASTSPLTVHSDDDSERPISRLSRRNRKTLQKRPKSAPSCPSSRPMYPIFNRPKSRSSLSNQDDNGQRAPPPPPPPPPATTQNARPPQKKRLHPFFAATAAAVSSARERSKPSKPLLPLVDAWHCPSATIHVNALPPSHPWRPKPQLATLPLDSITADASYIFPTTPSSPTAGNSSQRCSPFHLVQHAPRNTNLWAEFYKNDRRIDVINGSAIKELVDWLRKWYEAPDASANDSDADSIDSFLGDETDHNEKVAIVTGHTGCGKSTVIATAARQVGLSVLEINASTCRTGKRIREIIGDALSTHRVTHSRFTSSSRKTAEMSKERTSKPKARTLVVFEDVDQLQDDEKGFWTTLQKLASSGDCRRPIVCTATTLSSKMRHVFVEVKRPMVADMERLFINAKVDQALNPPPLPYKHICFSRRSERQSLAVLARVSSSEAVKTVVDMEECIALLCRSDTRRAINLLQFWGSSGLVIRHFEEHEISEDQDMSRRLAEAQDRISLEVIRAFLHDFVTCFLFQAGSRNFLTETSRLRSQKTLTSDCAQDSCTADVALDSWCRTLDTLSSADLLRGHVFNEKHTRSKGSNGASEGLCMHSDLQGVLVEAEELDVAALQFSRKYLLFASGSQQLRDMSHEVMESLPFVKRDAPPSMPYSRRPILSEYMPMLRTMAVEHERQHVGKKGKREGERFVRRTRSRSRREGFSALDLDPETISTLRKTSIRRHEGQITVKE